MVPLLRAPEPLPAPAEPAGFEFDFEDGVLPSLFTRGHLTPAPAGSSSRFCLIGTVAIDWPITYLVRIGQSPSTLFHYSSGGVLSFDYWVGDDVDIDGRTGRRLAALVSRVVADESRYAGVMPITVSVKDLRQAQNHHAYIAEYVREAWGHAELPLTALRDGQYRQALEPGDPIGQIVIGAGIPGGKPFYVDNVRLVIAPSPVALR